MVIESWEGVLCDKLLLALQELGNLWGNKLKDQGKGKNESWLQIATKLLGEHAACNFPLKLCT